MKRNYETPTLKMSGDVIHSTNAAGFPPTEGTQLAISVGSLGFGL